MPLFARQESVFFIGKQPVVVDPTSAGVLALWKRGAIEFLPASGWRAVGWYGVSKKKKFLSRSLAAGEKKKIKNEYVVLPWLIVNCIPPIRRAVKRCLGTGVGDLFQLCRHMNKRGVVAIGGPWRKVAPFCLAKTSLVFHKAISPNYWRSSGLFRSCGRLDKRSEKGLQKTAIFTRWKGSAGGWCFATPYETCQN